MAKIDELDLPADAPKETLDTSELPEQFGKSLPSLYPGTYKFRIPTNVASAFDVFSITKKDKQGNLVMKEVEVEGGGKKQVAETEPRIALVFDEEHPLEVVDGPPAMKAEWEGKAFYGRVTNAERLRGKKTDSNRIAVPDMTYLLQSLGFKGKIANGANRTFIDLIVKYAGHFFVADCEWSAFSNPNATRYVYPIVMNGEGKPEHDLDTSVEDPNNKPGSGKRWYMRDIPKDPQTGRFLERWAYPTGEKDLSGLDILEAIRAFPNLSRYRAAVK